MKLTFEQVKELVELGHTVRIETADGKEDFIYIKDEDDKILSIDGKFIWEINNGYECEIVTQPPKLLEVGRKVRVLESYEITEHIKLDDINYKLVGIDREHYKLRNIDAVYSVPFWAVYPVYEEEEKYNLDVEGIDNLDGFRLEITQEQYNKIKEILGKN